MLTFDLVDANLALASKADFDFNPQCFLVCRVCCCIFSRLDLVDELGGRRAKMARKFCQFKWPLEVYHFFNVAPKFSICNRSFRFLHVALVCCRDLDERELLLFAKLRTRFEFFKQQRRSLGSN